MNARDEALKLGEVLDVRRTRRSAAEMALGRARKAAHEVDCERDAQVQRLAELQSAWAASVRGASVDLVASRAWMRAIVDGEAELVAIEARLAAAEREVDGASHALMTAISRVDATEALSRAAVRRLGRRREEAALAEIDDRSARGSLRS